MESSLNRFERTRSNQIQHRKHTSATSKLVRALRHVRGNTTRGICSVVSKLLLPAPTHFSSSHKTIRRAIGEEYADFYLQFGVDGWVATIGTLLNGTSSRLQIDTERNACKYPKSTGLSEKRSEYFTSSAARVSMSSGVHAA